ncbi:MAG TPA: hypothetical protein VIB48_25605 [Acidimicrobiia bacterium]|jgi:hypothetical protein
MAKKVDLYLSSGQTLTLDFEHFLVHRADGEIKAIEFQPATGAPWLAFSRLSDIVAVVMHDSAVAPESGILGELPG